MNKQHTGKAIESIFLLIKCEHCNEEYNEEYNEFLKDHNELGTMIIIMKFQKNNHRIFQAKPNFSSKLELLFV